MLRTGTASADLDGVHLWMRHESRPTERRAPITPDDARTIVDHGARLTVEESPQRVFPIEDYAQAGAEVTPAGSWVDAEPSAYVLGIKELSDEPAALRHTHIYFAHAYKEQQGSTDVLRRFVAGGGELIDIEYLSVNERRVVAFGYWAGYVGASLSVLAHSGQLAPPLEPTTRMDLDEGVARASTSPGSALVIGARGRSGRGAVDALARGGWEVTRWGMEQTRVLDRDALLGHDLLVNCVVSYRPQEPFVTAADVDVARRLRVIGDVTCDVTSENNLIPLNTATTTWAQPVRRFGAADTTSPLDVIAIDNLPSLLPREASVSFSADFTPLLLDLARRGGAFKAAREAFVTATGPLR
ncbi:MAG: saccharopine dehydrogenase [Ornithinimicrobium sp.]